MTSIRITNIWPFYPVRITTLPSSAQAPPWPRAELEDLFAPFARLLVITDEGARRHHGERVLNALCDWGAQVQALELPDLSTFEAGAPEGLLEALLEQRAKHGHGEDDAIIAFGGGRACEIVIAVANLCRPSAPYVLAPTTLAAMLNYAVVPPLKSDEGAGEFRLPSALIIDDAFALTQDDADWRLGLMMALGIGLAGDDEVLAALERNAVGLNERSPASLRSVVEPALCSLLAHYWAWHQGDRPWASREVGFHLGHCWADMAEKAWNAADAMAAGFAVTLLAGHRAKATAPALIARFEGLCRALGVRTAIPEGIATGALVKAVFPEDTMSFDGAFPVGGGHSAQPVRWTARLLRDSLVAFRTQNPQ